MRPATESSSQSRSRSARQSIAYGTAVVLAVTVPCMVIEEQALGRPMIDISAAYWWPFAVLGALAFVAGGVVAGVDRGAHMARWPAQTWRGAAAGTIAVVLLLLADIIRRLAVVGNGLSLPVAQLWLVAGVGAIALAVLGAHLVTVWRRRRPHGTPA